MVPGDLGPATEWTRRRPDHDDAGGHVTGDHGARADEGSLPHDQPLQDDGVAADSDVVVQAHRPRHVRPGIDGDPGAEHGVVPDRGVVVDLAVGADRDAARHVRVGEQHAADGYRRLWRDDGARMDNRRRLQAPAFEQVDEPPADDGIGDSDGVGRARRGVVGAQHLEAADLRPGQAVVEEAGHLDPGRQRRVEGLAADAAGAGDVEPLSVHAPNPADPSGSASGGWLLDAAGVALLLVAIGWTYVAAATADAAARPAPAALLLAGVGVGYAFGRMSGRWFPVAGPGMLAGAVAAILVTSPGAFSGESGAPPLGYANANAALLVQVVAAVVIAALSTRGTWARGLLLATAVGLAAAVPLLRSAAGSALAAAVVLVGVAGARLRRAGWVVAAAAACAALAVAATVALGATAGDPRRPQGVEQVADEQLTTERVTLWKEALALARAEPLTGVGPGRFAAESPTARGDRDLRWAHTAVLERAAEQGIPGAILLTALAAWGFVALTVSRRPAPVVAAGAAAFAALALHGSVDYVLHFPAVPLAATALLGVASARPRRPKTSPRS